MKIRITADSTCDLSPEYVARHGVEIIPLTVTMGEKDYTDGEDIAPDDIFRHVDAGGALPKTAAINTADYRARFKRLLEDCDAIVHFAVANTTLPSGRTPTAIRRALTLAKAEPAARSEETPGPEDLAALGLTGRPDSAQRRSLLGRELGIGACNAKTFCRRLRAFGITREELAAAWRRISQENR